MDIPLIHCVIAIAAGMMAGFINTLAGNASAITLPVLIFLGLPSNVANGTNRVGVLMAAAVGLFTFHRHGRLQLKGVGKLMAPMVIGAIGGAYVATQLQADDMKAAIIVAMVLMLGLVLFRPSRWLKDDGLVHHTHLGVLTFLIFLGIGAWGGFIQAGTGILLLGALVLGAGMSLVAANNMKLVLMLVQVLPALGVFMYKGQVNWTMGLMMGVGQVVGAYVAARFASRHPRANVWIRRLLIVMIIAALAKLCWPYVQS